MASISNNLPVIQQSKEQAHIDGAHIGRAVGLSFGVSQIVAIPAIIVQLALSIFNLFKMIFLEIKLDLLKHNFSNLTGQDKNDKIASLQAQIYNTKEDLKLNMHRMFAGTLALIPGWGLTAAAAYLYKVTPRVAIGSPIEQSAAAVAEHLLMGGLGAPFAALGNLAIYPLSGKERKFDDDFFNPSAIKVPVNRGDDKAHEVECFYQKAPNQTEEEKTMLLFHGNGMTGDQMQSQARFYKSQGWNVLMLTMGGYPGSDKGVSTDEISSIQDVAAVLKLLEQKGVHTVGVHGYSIGSTLAMHATKMRPDLVKLAVLEKPLDSVPNVAANLVHNFGLPEGLVPKAVVRGAIAAASPIRRAVPGVPGYFTDGNNNLSKAAQFNGVMIVIGGNRDHLMARDKDGNGVYQNNFSSDIYHAHQGHALHILADEGHAPSYHVDELKKGLELFEQVESTPGLEITREEISANEGIPGFLI